MLVIIIIVAVYNSQLEMVKKSVVDEVYRVEAKRDIQPGETISASNVVRVQIPNVLNLEKMIFKMNETDSNQEYVESGKEGNADLWAVGKVATEKIYKGEILSDKKLSLKKDVVSKDTRLYSIPFDSETTGGYNIAVGESVDICVLYNDDSRTIAEYQNLEDNKVIDIVLAEKKIGDIRDESGNSAIGQENSGVVPGYVCFNLTYEEINKLELAKRQGTLFIGKAGNYYVKGSQPETFMPGAAMPNF